ncbi:MAG: caspase family protein [Planctomycetota bacterium]
MSKRKCWSKTICVLTGISLLVNSSCVTSTRNLGEFKEEMVSERKVKSEEMTNPPVVEITKKPSAAEPEIGVKVTAEMIRRDSFVQKYEKSEKIEQITSGKGLMILGGISMGTGLVSWIINTVQATEDTTLSDAENKENEDKYLPKAKQGLQILAVGLIPLIVGSATEKKTISSYRSVGSSENNITRDTNLNRIVPASNLTVNTSVQNDQVIRSASATTDGKGLAVLKIDNLLWEVIANSPKLPDNLTVAIEPQNGRKTNLPLTIEEAVAIMSHGKVDWSRGPEGLTPYPETRLSIGGSSKAGETATLTIAISNQKGKGDCYRIQALVKSDETLFNRRILIGHLKVGEEITVEDKVEIPRLWTDRVIPLTISFTELYNNIPDPLEARVVIEGLPRPGLAYSYQIIDDGTGNSVGNGDGQAQKGEALDIEVTVNNIGSVPAKNTQAQISFVSAPGEGVSIQRNNFSLGDLAPNESKKERFTIGIKKIAQANEFKLNLEIKEQDFNVSTTDTVNIKIGALTESKPMALSPKQAYVTSEEMAVYGGAGAESVVRFRLKKDSPLTVTGQLGDWYKVDLGNNRTGWVTKNNIDFTAPKSVPATTATATATPTVIEVMQKAPPLIVVANPQKTVVETTDPSIKIVGTVGDDRSVEKIDILLNGQVLKSLTTRGISVVERPGGATDEKVTTYHFEQEVTLVPGLNEIRIIAADDEGLTRSHLIKVTKIEVMGEVHLLVIGISNYEDPNIKDLPYAEEDARAILEFFRENTRSPVKPENITSITGKEATAKNIRKAIGQLAKKSKKEDMVIFYYAGHGDVGKHPNQGVEYYLIPVDAEKEDLFSTAMELSEAQRLWSAVTSKRKIFIADSCNSGGFTDLRGDVDGFEKGMGEGTIVMTASSRGQKALEDSRLKHGLFTYYLLEGLNGQANKDADNRVSITELKEYLDKNVPEKAREIGSAQTPVIKIESSGELYLTK